MLDLFYIDVLLCNSLYNHVYFFSFQDELVWIDQEEQFSGIQYSFNS